MLQINRNFLTIPTNDIYFETNRGESRYKAKLSCYTHRLRPSRQLQSKQTIHINLQQNEEVLINNLSSETKELLFDNSNNSFKLSPNFEPSFDQLRDFQRFYNENVHSGMDKLNRSKFQSLLLLRDQRALILTKIENEVNEVLSYRIYVVDGENALLLYVSSAISQKENAQKANMLLCWENMNMFRKLRYNVYDFGGIDREEHLRGSQLFGGSEVTVFSGYIAKSFASKMIAKMNQWREKND